MKTFFNIFLLKGENLKALEVAEEKAQQREEEYKKQVKPKHKQTINKT